MNAQLELESPNFKLDCNFDYDVEMTLDQYIHIVNQIYTFFAATENKINQKILSKYNTVNIQSDYVKKIDLTFEDLNLVVSTLNINDEALTAEITERLINLFKGIFLIVCLPAPDGSIENVKLVEDEEGEVPESFCKKVIKDMQAKATPVAEEGAKKQPVSLFAPPSSDDTKLEGAQKAALAALRYKLRSEMKETQVCATNDKAGLAITEDGEIVTTLHALDEDTQVSFTQELKDFIYKDKHNVAKRKEAAYTLLKQFDVVRPSELTDDQKQEFLTTLPKIMS